MPDLTQEGLAARGVPIRIWAWERMFKPVRVWTSGESLDRDGAWGGNEYILATPAALAASPEVQALIREAEARGMERAAGFVRSHGDVARTKLRETYDAGDARGNNLWGCIVGHLDITDDTIRAAAAAHRKDEEPK